ncbi:hypothetical protein AAFC00_006559 [Neodothiora populina]|uniref:AAA+ ATPase domain-containing protein n=1 Tax=Neodothiora populina TaxID=2781224 RepID=A0ABR3PBM6_9PEZI
MMRGKPASSMQKTYDDCYLICSTAVYFESQNNEAEALRSWRNALDQIYYHNAYRMPSSWRPKTETERALQDSLRQMELQCKERVDLLEALQQSRKDAASESQTSLNSQGPTSTNTSTANGNTYQQHQQNRRYQSQQDSTPESQPSGWLGGGTVPPTGYKDLVRPPALPTRGPPKRPSYTTRTSSGNDNSRKKSSPVQPSTATFSSTLSPPSATLGNASSPRNGSRTPSPEKRGGMLRTLRSGGKERQSSSKMVSTLRGKPPAAAKAATQAWTTTTKRSSVGSIEHATSDINGSTPAATVTTWDPYTRRLVERPVSPVPPAPPPHASSSRPSISTPVIRAPSPSDYFVHRPGMDRQGSGDASTNERGRQHLPQPLPYPESNFLNPLQPANPPGNSTDDLGSRELGPPDSVALPSSTGIPSANNSRLRKQSPARLPKLDSLPSYRKEYPAPVPSKYSKPPNARPPKSLRDLEAEASAPPPKPKTKPPPPPIPRKAVGVVNATNARKALDDQLAAGMQSGEDSLSSGVDAPPKVRRKKPAATSASRTAPPSTSTIPVQVPPLEYSSEPETTEEPANGVDEWDQKVANLLKNLPKGVDEAAAKQILNEIVIKGDEVHWSDVAGLEIAKSALKETVVYPFLRPDLFMGLREPARGMLLFGPPGTGKTMLARAVATESKSTFFAISASSLTSKYLGESEKLVRALFTMAKALAPAIIFVDEIDSLLSSRGGNSEHEATRRIKTEFLIQWSDLARAAAGRESTEGDATRVLVLAATNLPWAIDEAARRRFVRRQYIPLPEDWVRKEQLMTLLSAQKHSLGKAELDRLVARTEGFSGSDITALAKDAAMGPLRSLGEKLLHMSPEDIRPIQYQDFEASLGTIRPSVSKEGLKEFEDWAREFGERGG